MSLQENDFHSECSTKIKSLRTSSHSNLAHQLELSSQQLGEDSYSDLAEKKLQHEKDRLRTLWFLCFEDTDEESSFVAEIITPNIKMSAMTWWGVAMLSMAFTNVPDYFTGAYLIKGEVTVATVVVACMHIVQLGLAQFLVAIRCMKTRARLRRSKTIMHVMPTGSLEVDTIGGIVAIVFLMTVILCNWWRAGLWYSGDACSFYNNDEGATCPGPDTSDMNLVVLIILIQVFISSVTPFRAARTFWVAVFAPLMYFIASFPDGWSANSRDQVILQTVKLIVIGFGIWKGRMSTERKERIDWLQVRQLSLEVGELKLSLEVGPSERDQSRTFNEELALQRMEDGIRWENLEEVMAGGHKLVELGWRRKDVDAKVKAVRKEHSETFGVCADYLLSKKFTEFVVSSTGKDDPDFYEISNAIFIGEDALGKSSECPRDGEMGCSYLDTLAPQHKGPCTHFLSWTWSYKLSTVQSALRSWIRTSEQEPEEVHLWICFFANNQHRIMKAKGKNGSDNLETVFEENLLRIGKVVALLDTWMDPYYLQRIWCIFEQFTAAKLGVEISMILPPASAASLLDQIEKGKEGILFVKEHLSKVDSQNAKASVPTDEIKVKELIENSVGFEFVNQRITEALVKWMASEVHHYMANLIDADNPPGASQSSKTHRISSRSLISCAEIASDSEADSTSGTEEQVCDI